ncbi:MAG: penicillin-binding protein 2 [Coriobacteriia bacterium]|nr:penicillin-binding protein 2 [Coriobacteriia bacterium]
MRPEVISIIIGIVTFIVSMLVILSVLEVRSRRPRELVVRKSFGRAADLTGSANIDMPKDEMLQPEPSQDKNRMRIYLLGILASSVFGALIAKLWSLQLIWGDYYKEQAELNRRSVVSVPAIRGRILDRKGREMVGNRPTLLVTAPRSVADDRNLVYRLSLVLGIPKEVIRQKLLDDRLAVSSDRVLASDISMRAAAYIRSHPHMFENVTVKDSAARYYPFDSMGAHVLGYIGPITEDELAKLDQDSELTGEDYVGKTGAEWVFDSYLTGKKGAHVYQVDVYGNPTALIEEIPPVNGADVCLTIDLELQRATDTILQQIIFSAREIGREFCNAGALVAMDIEDGGILAMSSYPTYNPELFTQGISQELWDSLNDPDADNPLLNRVTHGRYPAASTFKAFTSLAGFQYGLINDHTTCYCSGIWEEYGRQWGMQCWIYHYYPYQHGTLDFEEALNQSCDVFFYDLAANFYRRWQAMDGEKTERFNELQSYLRSWGFGSVTGLDGLGESSGRVPDAQWKLDMFKNAPEEADWWGGDMANMIIGQGDLLVTPLQICNGYAGIARRKMLKPHLFHRVIDEQGTTVKSYETRESDVQPEFEEKSIRRMEEAFRRIVDRNGEPFTNFPVQVLAKTGTGEITSAKETCSWFVAYAPAENPKYCVACVVEQAGTGDSVAMQAVQHTLASIYNVDIGPVHAGKGSGER